MYTEVKDVVIKYLTTSNKSKIENLLLQIYDNDTSIVKNEITKIEEHHDQHGVSIGCIEDINGEVIGLAGLHFLQETNLYETYCYISPDNTERIGYSSIINTLTEYAFNDLNLDKVCARAQQGLIENELLIANGFTFLGERVFEDAQQHCFHNYYEIENDHQLIVNNTTETLYNDDWALSY